jgi:hypothetical protein
MKSNDCLPINISHPPTEQAVIAAGKLSSLKKRKTGV